MTLSDPRLVYVILILPSLFGLMLIGEGISSLMDRNLNGVIEVIFGILFLLVVLFVYLFFSMQVR